MTDQPRSCCDPFAELHGLPLEFVTTIIPEPATSLSEYDEQLQRLNDKLQECEACLHYRNQARICLRRRCDSLLDSYIQFADYLFMSPSDFEALLGEDNCAYEP